ncbi:hypothetical protein F5890DRAFT_1501249 [Lentinula detonsa]|uniref:Uncharacterized protein n=1 Tax=Lentinula detonsa TaxID=2804962 RepID=A0AA38Q4T5_9AGAR|nr:hypothetical protein F5890DRAFT_1501249 [Lentinula detonsa]
MNVMAAGQPEDTTGAQAGTPSAQANPPFNDAPQNPVHTPHVHPHPFMHPQGNMRHHPHHAGDSYVSIGFDFILSPNAPPLDPGGVNPPQVGAPGNPTHNGTSAMGVDHSSSIPNSNSPHATPDSIPHQADGGEPITSRNSAGAELPNQDMHGVELHAFGVNFGGFDSGSINEEGLMEPEFTGRPPQENQEDAHGSLASPDALITGNDFGAPISLPFVRLSNTRASPNISAAHQQPGAQRPGSADSTVNVNAQPTSNASPRLPDLSGYLNSMFGTAVPGTDGPRRGQFAIRRGGNRSQSAARGGSRVQPRSTWALPPPPGLTLRQTIERREREAGLRCWDVSCGLAPDDDCPYREIPDERKRQVRIRQEASASASSSQENGDSKGKGKEKADGDPEPKYVCGHTFHTPCLVTAQRVALNGAEEVIVEEGKSIEVSCPICRAIGVLLREDWEDGVRALETDLE